MERPAKERLIGAVVIVTVAWLLIPVFLDQRGADDGQTVARELALPEPERGDGSTVRRERVPLNAPEPSEATAPEPVVTALPVPEQREPVPPPGGQDTAVASLPDAGTPPAAEAAASEAARAPEPASRPAARASDPEPAEPQDTPDDAAADSARPADTPAAASGDGQLWAVQLGSFSDRDNAQRLAAELRAQGLPAFLSEVTSGGRTLHRVRVGPQADRAAAEAVAARLVAAGQTARVVRHP